VVTPTCTRCQRVIPAEDINVARDVAFCRLCNLSHSLAELVNERAAEREERDETDLTRPPPGAWYRYDGLATVIGGTHRSSGQAAHLLFFATFWNGILSVFVLLNLASTIRLLGGKPPAWFPDPIMDGDLLGVGMTIFLWIFLLPFIVVGLSLAAGLVNAIAGRTEIRFDEFRGTVFTGVGPIGRRQPFEVGSVRKVRCEEDGVEVYSRTHQRRERIVLELEGGERIRFGAALPEPRRRFVTAALRRTLLRSRSA